MPVNPHNEPLPPDDGGGEDVLGSQAAHRYLPPRYRGDSPLPPDPPGREDIMTPEPASVRAPRGRRGRGGPR